MLNGRRIKNVELPDCKPITTIYPDFYIKVFHFNHIRFTKSLSYYKSSAKSIPQLENNFSKKILNKNEEPQKNPGEIASGLKPTILNRCIASKCDGCMNNGGAAGKDEGWKGGRVEVEKMGKRFKETKP